MQQPDSPSTPAVLLERQWAERQVAIERAAEALRLKAEEEAEARARFERAVARDGQRLSSTARQATARAQRAEARLGEQASSATSLRAAWQDREAALETELRAARTASADAEGVRRRAEAAEVAERNAAEAARRQLAVAEDEASAERARADRAEARLATTEAAARAAGEQAEALRVSAERVARARGDAGAEAGARADQLERALAMAEAAWAAEQRRREAAEAAMEEALGLVDASSLRLEHSVRGQPSDGSPRRLQLLSRDGAGPPTVGDADGAAAAAPRARTPPAAGGAWAVEGDPDPVLRVAREQWAREASGEARRAEEAATALRIELDSSRDEGRRLAAEAARALAGEKDARREVAAAAAAQEAAEALAAQRAEHAEAAAAAATARAERACAALHQLLVRAGRRQAAWEKAVAAVPEPPPGAPRPAEAAAGGPHVERREVAWVDAAAAELGGWIDETHEALADADRRRERARAAQLSAEAALDDAVREASARAGRADRRSRHLVGAVHALGRDAVDLAEGAAPAAASARREAVEGRAAAQRWEAKANAAEAKNERVSGLLTRYAYRNQLLLPGMPACVASARASS